MKMDMSGKWACDFCSYDGNSHDSPHCRACGKHVLTGAVSAAFAEAQSRLSGSIWTTPPSKEGDEQLAKLSHILSPEMEHG